MEGKRNVYFFLVYKNGIWKGEGLDLGAEPPCMNFVEYSPRSE